MFGYGFDADDNVPDGEVDGLYPMGFGEAEKRIGHEILRVSGGEIAAARTEQFELSAFRQGATAHRH